MKKRRPSPLLRGGLMMLSIGAVTLLWPRLEPAAVALLQKAALFTTVLDMPAGALETLRERYAAELEPAPLPEEPSEPAAEPDPQEPEIPAEIPEVPEEYRGTVTELTMTGEDSPAYVRWDNIWIRNYTKLTAAEVQKVLATPNRVTLNPKKRDHSSCCSTHMRPKAMSCMTALTLIPGTPGGIPITKTTWWR